MLIQIKDPVTKAFLNIMATPEVAAGIACWRIDLPQNDSILITQETGQWKSVHGKSIEPELLDEIGKALHPLAIAQQLNRNRLDMK